MLHKGTRTLSTERLVLRPFVMEDAQAMFNNWASDPEVTRYLVWPTHASVEVSRMVVSDWVSNYDNPEYYQWAIVPRTDAFGDKPCAGEPIGSIAAVDVNNDTGKLHIGYCISRAWWNMGITSEALGEVIRFFFEEVEASRVEARHDTNNPNSGKVMAHCGMKYEGTLRRADRNNQGVCDAVYYGILREEYFSGK
ncbi:MAG: GNAT family N-acetyltransferase [Ruminococcaceae bacterium]|nr:GNAT family N-acetyltransferase [Oscillospiraceae bacterium]